MGNRHLSRSIVLSALFAWDEGGKAGDLPALLAHAGEEYGSDKGDTPFMDALFRGIVGKREELDAIIAKAAPEWPIERIAPIDRNILRLGLFELLFSDRGEVPPKVAINEAIELAKTFGSETSARFVNGVLGAVYKDIGEPGKEETSRTSGRAAKDVKDLPCEELLGALVFAPHEGTVYIALLHDVFGRWTLSKGHPEPGEEDTKALARIVQEELCLSGEVLAQIGGNQYIAADPEKGKVCKQVRYYLFKAPYGELKLKECGGLDDARWFSVKDVQALSMYDDVVPILTKGIGMIPRSV
jgi:N utilization substance protein B